MEIKEIQKNISLEKRQGKTDQDIIEKYTGELPSGYTEEKLKRTVYSVASVEERDKYRNLQRLLIGFLAAIILKNIAYTGYLVSLFEVHNWHSWFRMASTLFVLFLSIYLLFQVFGYKREWYPLIIAVAGVFPSGEIYLASFDFSVIIYFSLLLFGIVLSIALISLSVFLQFRLFPKLTFFGNIRSS